MLPDGRRGTRFIADAMLGSLARKLRAFGFDTSYYRSGDDNQLVELSLVEGRVVLTSDRSLVERARTRHATALLITGSKESQRITSLLNGAKANRLTLTRGPALCSTCNGRLVGVPKSEVSGKVPKSTERRHRLFFRCTECGQLYWRGAHWKKLRWLQRRLLENSDDPEP